MKSRTLLTLFLGTALLVGVAVEAHAGKDDWNRLSPKDKDRILRNYQRWQNLAPRDKEHLREEWDRWQSLPQDRRDKLKERYEDRRRRRDRD